MRPTTSSESSFSLGTYFGRSGEKFGFKLGGYLGGLQWIDPSSRDVRHSPLYPMLQLRLGNLDRFYGQFGFGDDVSQGVFGSHYRFLLGANLASPSSKNDWIFEFGAVRPLGKTQTQLYLGGNYIFADQLMLKPVFQIGDPSYYGLGIGVRVR